MLAERLQPTAASVTARSAGLHEAAALSSRRAQTHWIVTGIAYAPSSAKPRTVISSTSFVDRIDVIARDCERGAQGSVCGSLVARLPLAPSGSEDEVTVTQQAIHVIRMSAKMSPLAPDHIRQARGGGANVSPPGPQEDHGNPSLRHRVRRQSLRRIGPPCAAAGLPATTLKGHRRPPPRTSCLQASVRRSRPPPPRRTTAGSTTS